VFSRIFRSVSGTGPAYYHPGIGPGPCEGRAGPEEPHNGPEPREEPETAAGEAASRREEPFPHEEERPQEGLERPWWRRRFGG
jgi:hypothetical protein